MASFEVQIESLTSLTIDGSSSPTQSEVTQYLVDGIKEVTNKILLVKPGEIPKFVQSTHDNNDSGVTLTGQLYSVVREHDSTTILRKCDPIDAGDRYEALNTDSLHYRSKYNPGYYILDGKVHTVPASAGSDNDAIVTQTSYTTNTDHNSTYIVNFPDEYEYIVVLYAACKSLLNAMGNTLTNLTAYTAPIISSTAGGGSAAADLTTMTDSDWASLDFDFDDENIDFATWFQAAGDMIQKQEDFELASAQLEKISTYITGYQASVANSTTVFDKNFQKYSADYQWMADRHQRLYGEYTGYFNIMMGQKQAEQQAAQAQQQGGRR